MTSNDLINSNIYLADTLAAVKKRSTNKSIYYEDLKAAAYKGLVEAANKFEDQSIPFKKYAARRIWGEMEDYIRELMWGSRNNQVSVSPLLDVFTTEQKEDYAYAVEKIMKILPPCVMEMFDMKNQGMTMKEIGDKMGLSESMISKRMKYYREFLSVNREKIFR